MRIPASQTAWLLVKLSITAWLVAAAFWDWRTGLVPNWLTMPVVLIAGAVRLYQGTWIILPIWVLLFLIWRGHIVGGGDAKLLMGLFALFPTQQFAILFGVMVLAVSIPLMVLKHWNGSPLRVLQSIAKTLSAGSPLPSQEDLEVHGRRYAWTFCLPGLVYLWGFW